MLVDYRIPFWLSRILTKYGKDAVYFYKRFPGYKTIYSENGEAMWIGGFKPMPGNYPAVTCRILFLLLFKRNKK